MSLSTICSFDLEDSVCGAFGDNCTILLLVKSEEDMTSHLINLGVSSQRDLRRNPTISESMTICPKHRRDLTVDWPDVKVVHAVILLTEGREGS